MDHPGSSPNQLSVSWDTVSLVMILECQPFHSLTTLVTGGGTTDVPQGGSVGRMSRETCCTQSQNEKKTKTAIH